MPTWTTIARETKVAILLTWIGASDSIELILCKWAGPGPVIDAARKRAHRIDTK